MAKSLASHAKPRASVPDRPALGRQGPGFVVIIGESIKCNPEVCDRLGNLIRVEKSHQELIATPLATRGAWGRIEPIEMVRHKRAGRHSSAR